MLETQSKPEIIATYNPSAIHTISHLANERTCIRNGMEDIATGLIRLSNSILTRRKRTDTNSPQHNNPIIDITTSDKKPMRDSNLIDNSTVQLYILYPLNTGPNEISLENKFEFSINASTNRLEIVLNQKYIINSNLTVTIEITHELNQDISNRIIEIIKILNKTNSYNTANDTYAQTKEEVDTKFQITQEIPIDTVPSTTNSDLLNPNKPVSPGDISQTVKQVSVGNPYNEILILILEDIKQSFNENIGFTVSGQTTLTKMQVEHKSHLISLIKNKLINNCDDNSSMRECKSIIQYVKNIINSQ